MSDLKRRGLEIQRSIREVLFQEWDPIGLAGYGPDDEYDQYLGGVYRLLASGATRYQVAEYLASCARDQRGYEQATSEEVLPVADKLLELDIRPDTTDLSIRELR